jgi:hypothetical protein
MTEHKHYPVFRPQIGTQANNMLNGTSGNDVVFRS